MSPLTTTLLKRLAYFMRLAEERRRVILNVTASREKWKAKAMKRSHQLELERLRTKHQWNRAEMWRNRCLQKNG